jgi:hypothetical protein
MIRDADAADLKSVAEAMLRLAALAKGRRGG